MDRLSGVTPGGRPKRCDSSEGDLASQVSVASHGSATSTASWVSAPAKLTRPHCFDSRTCFRRPRRLGGGVVTASELRREGDAVSGLGGIEVRVLKATRHPAVERDFVYLCTSTNPFPFRVTRDHRLYVQCPAGHGLPVEAGDLVGCASPKFIYDGTAFREVVNVWQTREIACVVEVRFEADKCVPSWLLPKRVSKHGRPALMDQAAVTCFGASWARPLSEVRVQEARTFLDAPELDEVAQARRRIQRMRRAHSADGRLQGA